MMSNLRNFFLRRVRESMKDSNFDHWLICEFLVQLLDDAVFWSKEDILVVKKDPAMAFDILRERNFEETKKLSKKLLFAIGFFPESLSARRKRSVSINYYFSIERSLLNELYYKGEIWRELNKNLKPAVSSLNSVRARMPFKQPDIVPLSEIINLTGNARAFYNNPNP